MIGELEFGVSGQNGQVIERKFPLLPSGDDAADALDDLVGLVLGDLVEDAVAVSAFEGVEQRRAFPDQAAGEGLVVLAFVVLGPPDDPAGTLFAAELVDERKVSGLRR